MHSIYPRQLYAALAFLSLAPNIALASPALQDQPAPQPEADEGTEIVVQATRSGRRASEEAIRVEVLDREEVEEKIMMSPGNIAMLVGETPGLHVQVTSPVLGAANVRVQGLKGRYTQVLADGLPLYGGQTPAIGLLQIPPTDLGQVEIIKGAASALYGPSALGGVINLVSREPASTPESELLLNATSRGGQDMTAYASGPLKGDVSASLTGGYSHQARQDVNGDGWADLAGYDRWTLRPRLFWAGAGGAKALLTFGTMTEDRAGGTMPGRNAPDGAPFAQTLHSQRLDAGLSAQFPIEGLGTLGLRASAVTQQQRHLWGTVRDDDRHQTCFVEASLGGKAGATDWLAGAAYQIDSYRSQAFSLFNYSYSVPALFGQVEHRLLPELTVSASARWDDHNRYGSHISPRLSALYKPGSWTIRASLGRGFYAPTPLVEEIEANGPARLLALPVLRAETADSASLDLGYARGALKASVTLFGSNIAHAVQLRDVSATQVALINADGTTRTRGGELLLQYRWRAISVTGSYVHTDASQPDPNGPGRRAVPLTPRDTAGLTAVWEKPGHARFGLEAYYTGRQSLEDDPYASTSKPYVELGAMGSLTLGRISLFINAENLLGFRQTRYAPLLLPRRAPDGSWTVDAWAPLTGTTVNGGIIVHFGAKTG